MADVGKEGDALVEATRLGSLWNVGDYLSKSADALGRIPADVLRYWSSLPINNEYEPLGVRAVQGTNYAIDSGLQALSGGRWGLAPLLAGVGLPTETLERGIEDFGRRNAAPLKVMSDVGEVAAGVAPALHVQRSTPARALSQDEILASRVVPGYNPPPKPLRPFEADYPKGAETDGVGKLTRDIEGRRLGGVDASADGGTNSSGGGPVVVGRRVLGGQDETVPASQDAYDALAEALIGSLPERTAAGKMGRDAGRLRENIDPLTGRRYHTMHISSALDEGKALRTTGHEIGHAIDELSGKIPTTGLSKELDKLYNTLATGAERDRNLTRPKDLKYTPEEAPRELMAEAIRAYLTDPNYIKTVAPKTAAAIRAAVNDNPRVNKTIQFNQIAPFIPFSLSPDDSRSRLDR